MAENHSYEEIRDVVIALLSGREGSQYNLEQFEGLKTAVAEVFERRSGRQTGGRFAITRADSDIFREVFWDLFRQGIITLGLDDANPQYPWFRVSSSGRRILAQQPFIARDVEAYTKQLRQAVPDLDDVTLIYLQEAMNAFKADCLLSSSVMLGVAAEHTFLRVVEAASKNSAWSSRFKSVDEQKTVLQKLNKFRNILEQHIKELPSDAREDLDTHFAGILSVIRTSRNESGHPTGKMIEREQVYVLLQLFITYCKKMYALKAFFTAA